VRPRGEAVRRPRDFIRTGWLPMTRWPTGDMPGWSDGAIAGVRSPFVGRGASLGERPWGKNPGIMRKAVFSEGRGPRVRGVRPNPNPG